MIENTSTRDPLMHLLGAMTQGTSGYIEGMERDGQRQMVESSVLPIDLNYSRAEDFEALGFVFGEPVDDLFRHATLPAGWQRQGSDHAMWSYIVDERGIRRVSIFYKAAFYDRSAHMNIVNVGRHYASELIWGDGVDETPYDLLTDDEFAAMSEAIEQTAADGRDDERIARATAWLGAHHS